MRIKNLPSAISPLTIWEIKKKRIVELIVGEQKENIEKLEAKPIEELAGCFGSYAKNGSIEKEKSAWRNRAVAKHSAD